MTPRLLLATIAFCANCDSFPDAGAQAQSPSRDASAPLYLEFNLPDEFWTKTPDGAYLVTGFLVGYFRTGDKAPALIVAYPRHEVIVKERTGRIALKEQQISGRGSDVTVRLQTMAAGLSSVWSDPSTARGDLASFVAAPPTATRARRRILSLADVEKHERLFVALTKTLPPTAKPEQVLSAFNRIDQLAVAVVLCRDNQIPLDKLVEAMTGPPRRTLGRAILQVQPKLERSAVQKARLAAAQLLKP